MKQLKVISQSGQLLVDSREVAEMTGVRHADLLEKINGYVRYLTNGEFRSLDFFIDSTYQDSKGELRPCFHLTRKGCDMVANKMTGEKGVLFTAEYVTRFEQMEKHLQSNVVPLDERRQRIEMLKMSIEHEERIENTERQIMQVTEKVMELEVKVDEQITLDSGEQRKVQKAIARKVYELESDKKIRSEYFQQIHREIKDRWAVSSYKDVRRHEISGLLKYIDAWKPRQIA
ncbi:hypothetical protein DVH26_07630 [Paenibacillus sp. H1-7]|uniref:Rha family transcriptional regulator n=1 Tax=Paenibacillus sp. H1-7 TaxID=2282849 RepID=UPI001EF8DE1A|nr:Rha family transcriptional regulator [Paenibacillus sp. H1-7]ULL14328.1 hypothetical protein DVH26_07630 [Paenibacillus sp. H1-7]